MTDKALRDALSAKLGVTRQRISQRAQALKVYVPMSTEDATYCLAHQEGFALDEYLPAQTVKRVRILLRALGANPDLPVHSGPPKTQRKGEGTRTRSCGRNSAARSNSAETHS